MNKAQLIKHCGDSPKRYLSTTNSVQISNKNKPTPKECEDWLKNKSINPRNNRPIPKNGRIEKVLKENCKKQQQKPTKRSKNTCHERSRTRIYTETTTTTKTTIT